MKFFYVLYLSLAIFSLAYADFTSTSFELENPINIIGGGHSESTNFQYLSTTGQLTQGQSFSTSFLQNAGFLYFPSDDVIITPPISTGGGGSGKLPITPEIKEEMLRIGDFNGDGRVDILDLSILLYHIDQGGGGYSIYDLNNDGKLDFLDVSVLFYYWTFLN